MSQISYQLDDGRIVIFETTDLVGGKGPQPVSRLDSALEKAELSFENSLDAIRALSQTVLSKLREEKSCDAPAEIQLSFGLKASAEFQGFIVAKAAAEANYTVTMKWERTKVEEPAISPKD